jgi:hypothetical protein
MITPSQGGEWSVWAGPLMGVIALAGIALAGLGGATTQSLPGGPPPARVVEERSLPARLAAVDAALARGDVGGAVYAWRDAYGIALGSRQWEALLTVGDAAVRIDALAGRRDGAPTGFRAEARQAYLRALFDARAARSPEGMHRAADAFGALGDAEMAARAHAMAGDRP